ncbi:hypothetical protein [Hoeflea poritis]|uniref:Uncharacterized protein n=1 Tax=Hoeflea poritis TaxID=2993659 RepID=A0ABT4VIJ2_9HYPH|nr:hypothetical protein [Hoeflea poritis]MDA4844005.1 hypothetical protein [Hoeflea poritis]
MKHLELWLFLGFFGAFFAALAVWIYLDTADDRPSLFAEEHIEILRDGGAIRSDDPLFAGHERLCLFGVHSSEFTDHGCGIFNQSAIALFRHGQCEVYSPRNVPARIMIEYDWACRDLSEGFELRIFGAEENYPGRLFFDP